MREIEEDVLDHHSGCGIVRSIRQKLSMFDLGFVDFAVIILCPKKFSNIQSGSVLLENCENILEYFVKRPETTSFSVSSNIRHERPLEELSENKSLLDIEITFTQIGICVTNLNSFNVTSDSPGVETVCRTERIPGDLCFWEERGEKNSLFTSCGLGVIKISLHLFKVEVLSTDLISDIFLQGPTKCQKIRKFMDQLGWMPADSYLTTKNKV
ncbi:hypothetical protein CEXT_274991 [Caerostris extrusa]|uniref:Uncharacterized protein n=1 Tax=Caerostris extrusa TaxID=172846 RepID=A0AAV4MN15_CAEEX|nr:hypothetical protein CEXT_274991 [Caerostris extrusa]